MTPIADCVSDQGHMKPLPDIQSSKLSERQLFSLDWVGIENVHLPVRLFATQALFSSQLGAGVNLASTHSRGIHMSRLYSLLEKKVIREPIFDCLNHLVTCHRDLVESQEGLATEGSLFIKFNYSYYHQSLRSEQLTQRVIPLKIQILGSVAEPKLIISFDIVYSSTCPQSYALATQSAVEAFQKQFDLGGSTSAIELRDVLTWLEGGLVATPHAQRSLAQVDLTWSVEELLQWMAPFSTYQGGLELLLTKTEAALGTPSQSLVKRVDEKCFAELNAINTMFCEDAARRLYWCFLEAGVPLFRGEVRHFESLHPFDVMARFSKCR